MHLEIFSERENVGKLQHAMESLQKSMKWDEDVYGGWAYVYVYMDGCVGKG